MLSEHLVIDTNVLISGLIFANSKPNQAIEKAFKEYTVCMSHETFDEFNEVIRREKFLRYFPSVSYREHLIATFLSHIEIFPSRVSVRDCQDPKDNKFLEISLSVNAKYLVTGDKKDLLSMNPYRNVEIISVSEFLAETR
ncbi:MAG: putative toxin-antitoxin system toxin component, PIN family [Lonepinella koalarum]|nr:putative toxin-antitoxin system toxin component, PIN family [Lonepinella koalarum]